MASPAPKTTTAPPAVPPLIKPMLKNPPASRTDAGKQRSSLNALRHGLTGQTVVLSTEDHSPYQRHSQPFLDEYQPSGATEAQLVQLLVDTSWRMNRAAAVETNLFSLGISEAEDRDPAIPPNTDSALAMALAFREHTRAFAQISIYSQRLARQFERTLDQLRKIQEECRIASASNSPEAAKMLKMHKDENFPYQPADDGFVFSIDQIETFLQRLDRNDRAKDHDFESYA